MSCAHSDGWFAVECDWKDDDNAPADARDSPGLIDSAGDTLDSPLTIVGRARIFAPFFDGASECAEGLIVMTDDGRRYGIYWAKPSKTFRLVPVREVP